MVTGASALPATVSVVVVWSTLLEPGYGIAAFMTGVVPLVAIWTASVALGYVVSRFVGDEFRRLGLISSLIANARDTRHAAQALADRAQYSETSAFARSLLKLSSHERAANGNHAQVGSYIAHDMRTPLAGAIMTLDVQMLTAGESSEPLASVRRELRRLLRDLDLVVDVLQEPIVDALDEAQLPYGCESVAHTAQRVVDTFASLEDWEVVLTVRKDHSTSIPCERVRRILENLVGNAVRHGGGRASIEVSAGVVRISNDIVSGDERRSASTALGAMTSHGLGLRIVTSLLEKHAGKLVVEQDGPDRKVVLAYFPAVGMVT